MDKLDVMKLLLRVVETGSFSKAARQMRMAQSTASKQIALLEKRLGAQLLRRTSRGLTLTDAGQHYYDQALRLIGEFEALDDGVREREHAPAGLVRVSSPPGFAADYLLPALGSFLARYPGLSIDFAVSQRLVNLIEERVDVAVRVGDLESSDLRARQVGTTTAIVVASPGYLRAHGEPTRPADLKRHDCIASMRDGRARPWRFDHGAERVLIDPKGSIQSDNTELTRAAVKAGLGIGYAASWLFKEELASGAVRQLLSAHECLQVPIHAVWSGDRALSRRTALFIDFLAAICAAEPLLRIR
ncbi:LysR family transcriptional regulator [Cystobacter fuscus]|uniref:LysR family transcriptional regulator n=1 Tax=Cystobacter fuscus TaxID=43 RepID=UPI002B29BAB1|nr:LysR family transcriptional regulator [Cystobacter fuscus]